MEAQMMGHVAPNIPLSPLSVAYTCLFYVAVAAVLAELTLAMRIGRQAARPLAATEGLADRLADALLFRRSFRADPLVGFLAICFCYGLLLVALRHLRYVVNANWAGPAWIVVRLAQPLGTYGGLAFLAGAVGLLALRLMAGPRSARCAVGNALMLVLVAALGVTGYAMHWVPADLAALKAFGVGLVTFHWRPVPTDPLVLLHLWLAALFLVAVPVSGLPRMKDGSERAASAVKLPSAVVAALALLLLIPAGFAAAGHAPWTQPQPDDGKLALGHWSEAPGVMIRTHGEFLHRVEEAAVRHGERRADNTIERCVTCHTVRDARGNPVGSDDSRHFCSQCHIQEAVAPNCFTCHNSKPAIGTPPNIPNIAAIRAHLAEWSAKK